LRSLWQIQLNGEPITLPAPLRDAAALSAEGIAPIWDEDHDPETDRAGTTTVRERIASGHVLATATDNNLTSVRRPRC
jgi:hypothetical protein